nr:hypothetical protein [Luteimonas sp. BDR2-5]
MILLPAVVAGSVAVPARAFDDPPRPRVEQDRRGDVGTPPQRRSRAQDSMSESVRRIERTTRGRVLSAERMHSDGRDLNRIKVLDDSGRVRVYVDDPQQRGRPVRARGDDD